MDSELMRYATGEVKPRKSDQKVTGQAKKVYDRVRLADFEARGIIALAGDVMEGVSELDEQRKKLAGNDAGLNAVLGQIELEAMNQVTQIVRNVRGKPTRRLEW
jgi:hypothetical protein